MDHVMDILLVEDNPDHATLTRRILEKGTIANKVHWVKDGQEAVDFLFRKRDDNDAPHPGLIVLDINLPKINGLDVLKKIKEDKDLRMIPVIMLTTSDREEEVQQSYRNGANSFIIKPVNFQEFSDKINSLKNYWLLINRGPETLSR
ncbi:MAG: response regulator [Nitrospirae bacterium]|nr:response regulator [Nitrospirota bacterium]